MFIICGCNKKTFIVKMGAYFCIVGALYQNKRYLTIEDAYFERVRKTRYIAV